MKEKIKKERNEERTPTVIRIQMMFSSKSV
jgi:hypothetical protein